VAKRTVDRLGSFLLRTIEANAQRVLVGGIQPKLRACRCTMYNRLQTDRARPLLCGGLETGKAIGRRWQSGIKGGKNSGASRRQSNSDGFQQERPAHLHWIQPAKLGLTIKPVAAVHREAARAKGEVAARSRLAPKTQIDLTFVKQLVNNRRPRRWRKIWIRTQLKLRCNSISQKVLGHICYGLDFAADGNVVCQGAFDTCGQRKRVQAQAAVRLAQRVHSGRHRVQTYGTIQGAIRGSSH